MGFAFLSDAADDYVPVCPPDQHTFRVEHDTNSVIPICTTCLLDAELCDPVEEYLWQLRMDDEPALDSE